MDHHRQSLFFLCFFAILSAVLCGHQGAFDPAKCEAALAATTTAATCTDWQAINADVTNDHCCGPSADCNSLCTTVITGMSENCETRQQFGNFMQKNEGCQILSVEKAMSKALMCEDWGYIIQLEPRAFCIPKLGLFQETDENCTDTCIDIIEKVPDYCVADAIDFFQATPIRDFHANCTKKVVERVTNKADTCLQWKGLLELSIKSGVGCGDIVCTAECEALINSTESICTGYIARNEWNTIACATGSSTDTATSAAYMMGSVSSILIMLLGSFLVFGVGMASHL
mmetsp:Transcript_38520/g.93191  ORF Transcript_38520/g.93191 Transcript_38520/m.93191 type:complete len:286 (+) Transcript_38520:74-931(+)|eukprot:CAMPEP_0113627258 /NCGR_PEP_ID=MMETSP0017_2-20120614/14111_1 /TAXON_ID=2856 /ORGANISM="Cylindrotheca closterium" /LENGTH=285 /DNA_ID=CAMNT_0000537495 /DNA_START=40 /DNA_END=897 /DNA_ORIENTATION=+ /assembly_acc=CAM_ASM_000147